MRTALVRRTVLTASAVSLALLATACGSGEGDSKGDAKSSAKPSAAASPSPTPEAKALTAEELEKVSLVNGDVPKVELAKAGADDVSKVSEVSSDKAECKPLALVGSLATLGDSVTSTERIATGEPTDMKNPLSITITAVKVQSYNGKGAEAALASLKTAGTACAGGFIVTAGGDKTTIKSVAPATATAGDEAAAWDVTMSEDGEAIESRLVAFRKGSNLVTIQHVSFTGKPGTPQAFIDAQLKKLG
ncbi:MULTISPECIES: hypothetical protein [unclassified Streptomyces]|uniref:hypothetical protein n=1 Tax=unclassified Streptomyces TaxID=2593676 RepID=UPI00225080FF|nr:MULTISPECIES: hypothetical protein [unclassified Streptomyces]MCX4527569.1 hypothetical protein [Streptomyces sp. NBC_01551]MCX4541833.1 hypothetical protein [Streptomyces sp. NBC_01565]